MLYALFEYKVSWSNNDFVWDRKIITNHAMEFACHIDLTSTFWTNDKGVSGIDNRIELIVPFLSSSQCIACRDCDMCTPRLIMPSSTALLF